MFNNYCTHLPILEFILSETDIKTVYEYGMGLYSTKLFVENVNQTIAVEMQDESWFGKIQTSEFIADKKDENEINLYCMIGADNAIDFFKCLEMKFDLVFVDGNGSSRFTCINEAFGKCDIIVAHDTETPSYNWHLVNKPLEYTWLDIKKYNPWTSVITNNKELIVKLTQEFGAIVR